MQHEFWRTQISSQRRGARLQGTSMKIVTFDHSCNVGVGIAEEAGADSEVAA
jgi:hypothetical protein